MGQLLRGELPPNFDVREFVHPHIYDARGPAGSMSHVTQFQLDYSALLREKLGVPVILNNWHVGGKLLSRGTRPPHVRPPGGGSLSMHYMGMALDCSTAHHTPKQVHECLHDNFAEFWAIGLTTLESLEFTKTWTHGDGRLYLPALLIKLEKEKRFVIVEPKD